MCCSYGNGSYQMAQADGTLVLQGDGNFGTQVKQSFSIDATNTVNDAFFQNLRIYPNPSTGIFNISGAKDMDVTVFDVLGNQIINKRLNEENTQLSLDNLAKGLYFAKFQKDGKTGIKKLIIK